MGTDLTATPRTTACPSCGASLRPDAPWCTLCYADLRPKPAPAPPVTAAPATAAYSAPAGDPLTQPLLDFLGPSVPAQPTPGAQPTWPCSRCEARNPFASSQCSVCGGDFLAAVKDADAPRLVLPLVGDLGAMSRGRRAGLALGLVALLLVPLALLTLLLTHRPDTAPGAGPGSDPGGSVSTTTGGGDTGTGTTTMLQ